MVPRSKVRFALTQCHTGILRGHWGPRKTFDLAARQYSFPNMKQVVAEFVRVCPTSQNANAIVVENKIYSNLYPSQRENGNLSVWTGSSVFPR